MYWKAIGCQGNLSQDLGFVWDLSARDSGILGVKLIRAHYQFFGEAGQALLRLTGAPVPSDPYS